jgi:hypothetical protein
VSAASEVLTSADCAATQIGGPNTNTAPRKAHLIVLIRIANKVCKATPYSNRYGIKLVFCLSLLKSGI